MRSFIRKILMFILLVAVLLIALIGTLHLILQTAPARQIVQHMIEHSLGTRVSLGSMAATPLGGVKVSNVSAGETNNSGSQFSVDSLVLFPRYLRLLQGKIEIGSLHLEHPVAQYPLLTEQKLFMTPPSSTNATIVSAAQGIPSQPVPELAPSNSNSPSLQQPHDYPASSSSQSIIQDPPRLTITDGKFTLLTFGNLPVVSISNLNLFECPICDGALNGTITASTVVIGSTLILHDLKSRVNLSPKTHTLSLNTFTAALAKGNLTGNFSILLPPEQTRYQGQLTLSKASLSQFFVDASLGNCATEGIINGDLSLSGIAGLPRSMAGKGSLSCSNAVIQPADFLRQIGQILSIQELQLLRLSEGKISFTLQQGQTHIDEFTLNSENLILTANGPVDEQGNLDLRARLLFNDKLTGRLKGILGQQLTQAPEPGYSQVAFHLTGSPQNPKTDLLERLTGIRINGDLGGFLQGIFGHH